MNMSGLMIGSEEPSRMVAFYTELFGDPTFDEGGYTTWHSGLTRGRTCCAPPT